MTWQQIFMGVIMALAAISAPFSAAKQPTSGQAAAHVIVVWTILIVEYVALATGGFW